MLAGDGQIPGPDFDNDGQLRPTAALGVNTTILVPAGIERDVRQAAIHCDLGGNPGGNDQRQVTDACPDMDAAVALELPGKIESVIAGTAIEF